MARYQAVLRGLGWLVLAMLALTPLVMDPLARDDPYMTPKWAWLASWGCCGLAMLVARAAAGRPVMIPLRPLLGVAVLWALWHWASVLWAASAPLALERAARISWLTAALLLAVHTMRRRPALLWMAWAAVALGGVTAGWVLVEDALRAWAPHLVYVRPNLPDWRGVLAAGLGNTNHIGDLLALALLPALALYGESRRRGVTILLGALAVLIPAALIVCFSVGSNLGLMLGAAVMLGLTWRRLGLRWFARRGRRWAVLAGLWLATVLFLNLPLAINPHAPGILREGFGSGRWHEGGPTRLAIWAQTLEMIRQAPLLGVGAGNFVYRFPEMDSALVWDDPALRRYQGMWTNAAHNAPLQTWAELGVPGLFLLAALLALAFRSLLADLALADRPGRLARIVLAGLLTAWLGHALMNFPLQTPVGAFSLFTILAGVIVERQTRSRLDVTVPQFALERGPLRIIATWETMQRPTALGIAARAPSRLGVAIGVATLALAVLLYAPSRLGPVRAQRAYRVAAQAADQALADAMFRRALEWHPGAADCRSAYSRWLNTQGRFADALEQLRLVRRRLNSNELWLREARALEGLGRRQQALDAGAVAFDRVWNRQWLRGTMVAEGIPADLGRALLDRAPERNRRR